MNTKVVPNPEQKGWEEDGTTPNGTPIYKWESGGSGGGSAESAVLQDREEDQKVVSEFTFTANPTQDGLFTNAPNRFVVDADEKRASFLAGSDNISMSDSYVPWDVDIQGSLNMMSLGFPYSNMQYTAYGFSNGAGSVTLSPEGNVGIGTGNPQGKLTAAGPGGSQIFLEDTSAGNNGKYFAIGNTNANMAITRYLDDGTKVGDFMVIDYGGDATFSGTITATRKDNSGAPTSTIDPAVLLMGGDSNVGDGGELGFGAFTDKKFAAIKGYINDASGNGAGQLDFYIRKDVNAEQMDRALRITNLGNAEFAGSITLNTVGNPISLYAPEPDNYTIGTQQNGNILYRSFNRHAFEISPAQSAQGEPTIYSVGNITSTGTVSAPFLSGTVVRSSHIVQDGAPVIDAKGLINTLTTLRKATMDETQDIRESLRSAIDELVAGFEQQIATMPAEDSE